MFDTPDEMVSKMQSNGADFDVVVTVTLENVGKLAQGGLIQPLNKTYLTTPATSCRPAIPDFYDVGRQYSMPYVIFTTGISWRNDEVSEDIAAHGQPVGHLLGHRVQGPGPPAERLARHAWRSRCCARATTRTDDPAILDEMKQDLLAGADEMGWKYDHVDYTELSTNLWQVHDTWSGQMAYYQYYLPEGPGHHGAQRTRGRRRAREEARA